MRIRKGRSVLFAFCLLAGGAAAWFFNGIAAARHPEAFTVRFSRNVPLSRVLDSLAAKGVVKSPQAARFLSLFQRREAVVSAGTYRLPPNATASMALDALRRPMRQMVRIPETNWSARTANILQEKGVCSADAYRLEAKSGEKYRPRAFPIPSSSLEGYLYPDTYDLPPLLGATGVIERQLDNFGRRVWMGLNKPRNLHRVLTVASMVEMEVNEDAERPLVAGVIENRLAKGMRLQIDATVNFALQKWRALSLRDLEDTKSPYNTYLVRGLPPGPICSPSVKSIQAAIHPAKHSYLYYVAMPDGHHLFSETYDEHRANITRRRAALERAK